VVLDAGQLGYRLTGLGWVTTAGAGYGGSYDSHAPGGGADTASWQVDGVLAARYDVRVSWVPPAGAGSNVSYTVYDGAAVLARVTVDQRLAPSGEGYNGTAFQSLGTFTVKSGSLRVVLADDADGSVSADALFVVPV
jgi:hypothetical protein